ncbi:MAG: glucuronate isomerase [Elusimicrobiota bacterium]
MAQPKQKKRSKNRNTLWMLGNPTSKIIYNEIKDLPVYDMHTHVNLKLVLDNNIPPDPWTALCAGDHYVSSIIESLGTMGRMKFYDNSTAPYDKWTAYAAVFPKLAGVQVHDWMRLMLQGLGVEEEFNLSTAKSIWSVLNKKIQSETYRPVEIFKRTNIEFMSTTDSPVDNLEQISRAEKFFPKHYWRPAWRPDGIFNIIPASLQPRAWMDNIELLEKVSGKSIKGSLNALKNVLSGRHDFFSENGCRASDYGMKVPYGHEVSGRRAEDVFIKACKNEPVTKEENADFQAYMLRYSMEMDYEKGWVSQIHYGPLRNMREVAKQCGGVDSGCDTVGGCPDVADALRPLLNYFDTSDGRHHKICIYTLDKSDWMKIAGLSRIYPSVYAGMSWWYYDSVSGMLEYFRTVPDAGAGLCKVGPFVTDARNIYSLIPRTEVYRRCLSTVLGEFVEFRGNSVKSVLDLARYLCGEHVKGLLGL